jgi:hypothetical protein
MFNVVNLKKPCQRKKSKHGENLKEFGLMMDIITGAESTFNVVNQIF